MIHSATTSRSGLATFAFLDASVITMQLATGMFSEAPIPLAKVRTGWTTLTRGRSWNDHTEMCGGPRAVDISEPRQQAGDVVTVTMCFDIISRPT
ncbi:hypothetical protein DPM35_27060 [Mesorhizobium atlanticum]|uniref:Uncharacterized protein n=1 Tax=Mesorhizobium atlanticum TaxID=2233532 RepID=A0A330GKI5_9HYPH|nr:hypothetical protein DPM35_27060 [Mesorhizobium atlanticum]